MLALDTIAPRNSFKPDFASLPLLSIMEFMVIPACNMIVETNSDIECQ